MQQTTILRIYVMLLLIGFFSSCVSRKATIASKSTIPESNGAMRIKPKWTYQETVMSKASPYLLGGIGGAIGYLSTPSSSTSNGSSETDPRITNAFYGAIGGFVIPGLIKKLVVKSQKRDYVPTEAKDWIKDYNRVNNYRGDNAFVLEENEPSTHTFIMINKGLYDPTGSIAKDNPLPHLDIRPVVLFENQIFPSFVIGTSTYNGITSMGEFNNISGSLGISVSSKLSGLPFRYEIECVDKKFFDKIEGVYETKKGNYQSEIILPKIPWNYNALRDNITSTTIGVYFRIYDKKGNKEEKFENIQLRSINDCLYYYYDKNNGINMDMRWLFAAYVNEEHPMIDRLLKDGLDKNYIEAWGTGSPTKQVEAVWKVLQDKGIKYSNTPVVPDYEKSKLSSQAVRQFTEAINNTQANCIDGTIVFASILRKIGINPIIVLIPGHAFLGYYGDDPNDINYLETTLLGSGSSFEEAWKMGLLTMAKRASANKKSESIDIGTIREIVKPLGTY